ncbi:MAG: RluA family pseudouridine synthase [Cyclobacteriaceae bacterium]|nr:RluA family pseudouridine synthase [Cyclobacteriaceae bacterium]MCH8516222.1 RluA family pseudouridine synthase [Cyclobacteriaceae bacterium]
MIEYHLIPPQTQPQRLQALRPENSTACQSQNAWKKALKNKFISIDGEIVSTSTYVNGGETICINIPAIAPKAPRYLIDIEVIYEDEDIALINKPAGIAVSGNQDRSIVRQLPFILQPSSKSDSIAPQPAHRLDYPTTGILLIGKTRASLIALQEMFAQRQIEKEYLAIAIGENIPKKETIKTPIDEKPAVTHFQLIDKVNSNRFTQLSLLKLRPKTGRKHQIRKHLSGIGHPILGDATYCPEKQLLKGKGLYLHAYRLKFTHPNSANVISMTASIPHKFYKIFEAVDTIVN